MTAVSGRERHHRRSIRLQGHDYSRSGAYYVTLCTQDRVCLFGEVVDEDMHINGAGQMASDVWHTLPDRFPAIDLDAFVIMPNHIHGIVVIADNGSNDRAGLVPAHDVVPVNTRATARVALSLGDVIGTYKSLNHIRQYILDNPRRWHENRYNLNVREGNE